MASNGLVPNPKKTTLLFLNNGKTEEHELNIRIGKETIAQVAHVKLLGVTFDENQKWNSQVYGKGGVISCLDQRLYVLRRLKNFINKDALVKVATASLYQK